MCEFLNNFCIFEEKYLSWIEKVRSEGDFIVGKVNLMNC